MASVTTATSEWIQFFKDAGIPAGLAVTYAVSFVDNRIQKNMLMDLSKDIMMDLGITVIGDIIAILKHGKQVYRQDMCKMATEAISSGQTSVQAELRRTANTQDIEEQLIAMIQERAPLYDITEKCYANRVVKTQLWQEIETKLVISEELKKKWDSLRTQYTRYKKLAPSGSAGAPKTGRQHWILTRLQFLEPHTKTKETTFKLEPSTAAADTDSPSSETCASTPEEPCFVKTESRPSSPLAESTICGGVSSSTQPSTSTLRPRAKRSRKALDESSSESTSLMHSIGNTLERMLQDDHDDAISAYCKNIEHKMRQLPPHVLPYFQHEVDNCLFKYLVDQRQTETSDTHLTLL
ncbi:uncharacterized protein C19orf47 homolog isoform X4 [Cololabis saira]|uniref:uncharacterized protein C19orf47 homolog isoform X4 n=1 Tax=Cololabis saira TaxID=129043 RepID=UPI002AD26177|nr:uncharacterized protein C19orf47 homolog isoform X4 [Cololabis saira]